MEGIHRFICWRYFINLVFLLTGLETFAQDIYREIGLPYFQNYDDDVYKARYDNWGAFQASNGLMYFGNGFGILEFDGASWRLIQMPNQGVVRSFAMDSEGRIFVGGHADFGYLEPDAKGQLQFFL